MSGGGGFDPGKELAQLDKDLSLSQNAPLIAAATAMYFTGGLGGETLSTMAAEASSAVPLAGSAIQAGEVAGIASLAPAATAAAPAAIAAPAAAAGAEFAGVGAYGGTAAGDAALASGNAGAGAGAAGIDAIGSGIGTPYVGPQAAMPTSMAAPPAAPPSLFDQATTAYGKLNPVAKYGIPLAAAAMLADRNKGGRS